MPLLTTLPHATIVAFVSQTGNVAKTTLAAATGVELAGEGLDVTAIDLDAEHRAQGASLATWAEMRAATHPERTQLAVRPADTAAQALTLAAAAAADSVVLIDCPSRATEATARIAAAADLVVFPLNPGAKDAVLTIVGIGRIVAAGIPAGRILIVLTRTGSDAEADDHRVWIEGTDIFGERVKVAAGHIPERIAYRQAISRGLTLREAQPASLRRIAGGAIDEIIAAIIEATSATPPASQERGAA